MNQLFTLIQENVARHFPAAAQVEPVNRDFRPGDVRHSLADIDKAKAKLRYDAAYSVQKGLDETAAWYLTGE